MKFKLFVLSDHCEILDAVTGNEMTSRFPLDLEFAASKIVKLSREIKVNEEMKND